MGMNWSSRNTTAMTAPAFNLARDLRMDPAAGRVMAVIFRDDQFIPIQGSYASTWRADRTKAGAGTFIEHSIHDVDMLEHVVGPVTHVAARSANRHGHEGIEDVFVASLTFADGGLGTLTSVWHDILSRPSLRRVEIFCANRWITIEDDWFGPVTWQDADAPAVTVVGDELVQACVERGIEMPNPDGDFVRAVRDGTPTTPDVTDALRAHRIVDAAYRSAADGGTPIPI